MKKINLFLCYCLFCLLLFACMAGESYIDGVLSPKMTLNESLGVSYTLEIINDNDVIMVSKKDTIFMSVENSGIFTDMNKTVFIKTN